jgi:hypothetical protein
VAELQYSSVFANRSTEGTCRFMHRPWYCNRQKEWKPAEPIQVNVDCLKQLVDTMRKDLDEVKGALKESLLAFQHLIKQGKHVEVGGGGGF